MSSSAHTGDQPGPASPAATALLEACAGQLAGFMRSTAADLDEAAKGCMVLAFGAELAGDAEAQTVHRARADTIERFAAWLLAQSHEIGR